LFVWVLVSCSADNDPGGAYLDGSETTPVVPAPDPLALAVPTAFDPLRASLEFSVSGPAEASVTVTISGVDGSGPPPVVLTLPSEGVAQGSWDGKVAKGWAAPGAYTVTATSGDEVVSVGTALVRTGFVTAWLDGDGGLTAAREPIYWPGGQELADGSEPVSTLTALDDGAFALDFAAVPEGILPVRPLGAEPAAFRFDSRPILTLDPPLGTGLDGVDTAVSVEGWAVLSGVPVRPGTPVVLQRDEPLSDTVGVSQLDLALTFSAGDQVLGEQHLPLKIYRMLAASQFDPVADRYFAWAPVLEEALTDIEGTVADDGLVTDALVSFVYFDLGLTYDTVSGASVYSTYEGFDFQEPHFLLSDFLVRRFGNVINCSDAATILGAYANMVGVPLDHLILDPSFDLNYILAIGQVDFTSCPFGPGGCGFSYHAVTTLGTERQIWDATLALDGDKDAGSLPSTELLVQQIDGEEYYDRLVRSGSPSYNNQARETLQ
jgi:hypothetical protein